MLLLSQPILTFNFMPRYNLRCQNYHVRMKITRLPQYINVFASFSIAIVVIENAPIKSR